MLGISGRPHSWSFLGKYQTFVEEYYSGYGPTGIRKFGNSTFQPISGVY
ncbi:hypothetical protein PF1067 [Pyrococcus furiosus DSM 3638]|uniref:Uncharacterized protein n=1 Tax=Pyrococcus furiosus (strain ATCC 43587 / DSM 3638 / JCM 8422 / Vc1) TaxID=186497 RepID=Q8U1Y7_PYRFU|nr:hypothetical protein PF1067 [Pyrococcus furiosus DSM 3638]